MKSVGSLGSLLDVYQMKLLKQNRMKKQTIFDPEHTFFTSDTHFYHSAIIGMCNRPFSDVDEMNCKLIENWNSVVSNDDVVFHLGDFCFGGSEKWYEIAGQLNGRIYLIKGNHDDKNYRENFSVLFEDVSYQMKILIEDKSIYLNHFPFLCYGGAYHENHIVWQLFGHVHSGPNSTGKDCDRLHMLFPRQYDVGVDGNNYTPISYMNLKEKLK